MNFDLWMALRFRCSTWRHVLQNVQNIFAVYKTRCGYNKIACALKMKSLQKNNIWEMMLRTFCYFHQIRIDIGKRWLQRTSSRRWRTPGSFFGRRFAPTVTSLSTSLSFLFRKYWITNLRLIQKIWNLSNYFAFGLRLAVVAFPQRTDRAVGRTSRRRPSSWVASKTDRIAQGEARSRWTHTICRSGSPRWHCPQLNSSSGRLCWSFWRPAETACSTSPCYSANQSIWTRRPCYNRKKNYMGFQ